MRNLKLAVVFLLTISHIPSAQAETANSQTQLQDPINNIKSSGNQVNTENLTNIAYCFEALAKLKKDLEPGNQRYLKKYLSVYKAKVAPVEDKFIKCIKNDQSRRQTCLDQLSPQEMEIAKAVGGGRTKGNELASSKNQNPEGNVSIGVLKLACTDGPVGR